ncbi:sugar ABC transporter substrate-binding protein [Paenibacillus xylaniclasticus]|uniref:sugar ABC transporter substrate-binding protein n=1 Tax=Paenibacillus xylaniclasticus TaxID=588083 RepID=UPI000FD8C803|nr:MULTISPECIES: sugar ABC transporter substrate-binding protein [Paenibacillus]GFN30636.1 methylthioribose-binding protein [Paenibacillus curdlanolyticus]
MKKVGKSALFALIAVILLITAACGNSGKESSAEESNGSESTQTETVAQSEGSADVASLRGKKIALVMQFNTGTFSAQYIEGVKEQVEKFGGKVQVFAADNDLAKMSANLDAAINQGFDGILIDHGQASALKQGVNRALEQKIPVVAFDADLNIPGVTVLSQDDQMMATKTLELLKEDAGGKGNIVKIWVAGFAPMERRNQAYKAFMDSNPDIKEITTFGTANNPALDAQSQMEAILKQYPNKGDITAVWAAWDEFAKGAARAIQQAGRTEIKLYGIDMSDEDLQMIQDPTGPWVASAAVDPKDIGRVQVRYLYQKLHGDTTDESVVLDAVVVKRDELPTEAVNTTQLGEYVQGWSGRTLGITDWMTELEQAQ